MLGFKKNNFLKQINTFFYEMLSFYTIETAIN